MIEIAPCCRYEFLVTLPVIYSQGSGATYNVQFEVSNDHHLVVDVIDYNPNVMQENFTLYDSQRGSITENTRRSVAATGCHALRQPACHRE